jgi:hypothetical protein
MQMLKANLIGVHSFFNALMFLVRPISSNPVKLDFDPLKAWDPSINANAKGNINN